MGLTNQFYTNVELKLMTFFFKICQFTRYPEAESNVQWSKHDEKILELKKKVSMPCICV